MRGVEAKVTEGPVGEVKHEAEDMEGVIGEMIDALDVVEAGEVKGEAQKEGRVIG